MGKCLGCVLSQCRPYVSLNSFLCSPVPCFSHEENGAKPCAKVGFAQGLSPISQAKAVCLPKLPLVSLMKWRSSGREEPSGDHVSCLSASWPEGGFSDTSGSVRLSLVAQPARGYNSSSQCNSRLTEVYLAVNKGGLFVLMPSASDV